MAPTSLGVVWIFQLVPFHSSTKLVWAPVSDAADPTALQVFASAHDTTVSRTKKLVPIGFGVGWIFQAFPSQTSANVSWPVVPLEAPTASQARTARHDTPSR